MCVGRHTYRELRNRTCAVIVLLSARNSSNSPGVHIRLARVAAPLRVMNASRRARERRSIPTPSNMRKRRISRRLGSAGTKLGYLETQSFSFLRKSVFIISESQRLESQRPRCHQCHEPFRLGKKGAKLNQRVTSACQ